MCVTMDTYLFVLILECLLQPGLAIWSEWWTYDGISGPEYWGLLNSEWRLCSKGRYQSPVDINPKNLVFDPSLGPVNLQGKHLTRMDVQMENTGHDLTWYLDSKMKVIVSGGPLAYKYRIQQIKLHFGSNATRGSEHTVGGHGFPAEIQFLAYNTDLYLNLSAASSSPHGVCVITVFAKLDDRRNSVLDQMITGLSTMKYKGSSKQLFKLDLSKLLPETQFYLTYDGSLTFPPCYEVVTWILMNRPVSITKSQLHALRQLSQVEQGSIRVKMANNYRKPRPIMSRTIRTNIKSTNEGEECVLPVQTKYEVNDRFRR